MNGPGLPGIGPRHSTPGRGTEREICGAGLALSHRNTCALDAEPLLERASP